jgi:phage FluMu gp28-like protein
LEALAEKELKGRRSEVKGENPAGLVGRLTPLSPVPNRKSVIQLYPYQRRLFDDRRRILVAVWCRQAGKDFASAAKADDDAFARRRPWNIVSLTQRQADVTFDYARKVAEAVKRVMRLSGRLRYQDSPEYLDYDAEIDEAFRCTARTIHFPGGGSVTSLPGRNPDNLAGLHGSIVFTEFGLFPGGGYDHWRVVAPLATRGGQILAISTPRGKNTRLFEMVSDPATYGVHLVDIHQAVAEGMPLLDNQGKPTDVETYRKQYNDEPGWQREYLCQFTGDLESLVKWAVLQEAGRLGVSLPFDLVEISGESGWQSGWSRKLAEEPGKGAAAAGRLEIGWDVARHKNLSAVWINRGLPDRRRHLRALIIMRDVSFALQREVVSEVLTRFPSAVGIGDSTGMGMDSNETLHTRFGDRWCGLNFSGRSKRELASGLLTALDDYSQVLPSTEGPLKKIATDIYALQREGTGEQLRVAESPNPLLEESHCDIAWAAALAVRAGTHAAAEPYVAVI